jgi:hypothetical protein
MVNRCTPRLLGTILAVALGTAGCLDDEAAPPDDEGSGEQGLIEPDPGDKISCASPTIPTMSLGAVAASSITWTLTSTCANATLRLERQSFSTWSLVAGGSYGPWTVSDTGVAPATTYCYRAGATIGSKTVYGSASCATTTMAPPTAPAPGLSTKSTYGDGDGGYIQIVDTSTNEAGFRFWRRVADGTPEQLSPWENAWPSTGRAIEREDNSLPRGAGVSVCYQAEAFNAGGSAYSPEVCTTTEAGWPGRYVFRQWKLYDASSGAYFETTVPAPGAVYALRNTRTNKDLAHGGTSWGVKLTFEALKPAVRLYRNPASSKARLKNGELVALKIDGGGYLVHQSQTYGVDLGFRTTYDASVFQWRIIGGEDQPVGGTLTTDTYGNLGLYNTVAKAYLVNASQTFGISLGWAATPVLQADEVRQTRRMYQDPVQLSRYAMALEDRDIVSLYVPEQPDLRSVSFSRMNDASAPCDPATFVATVAPGQHLTALQLQKVFHDWPYDGPIGLDELWACGRWDAPGLRPELLVEITRR